MKIHLVFLVYAILLIIFSHVAASFVTNKIRKLKTYLNKLINNSPSTRKEHLSFKELNEFADQFTDLIGKKQIVESKLQRALVKAEESARLKTAFLNNMSHEIRTPLNAIVGFSNLLLDDSIEDESKQRFVDLINKSSDHLLNILNEILYISKLETSDKVKLNLSEIQLENLIKEVRQIFLQQRDNEHIELIVVPDSSSVSHSIITDRDKLIQALSSLVSNALKFTPEGYVKIGLKADAHETTFYVEDSGLGIDDDEKEKIFDRFYQVDHGTTNIYSGVGLGLNITSKIISLLGGKIWVESEKGKGSTFFFSLPNKTSQEPYNTDE